MQISDGLQVYENLIPVPESEATYMLFMPGELVAQPISSRTKELR